MAYDHAQEYGKERAFDAYCKTTLRNAAKDLYRKRKRRQSREVSLSDISDSHDMRFAEGGVVDEYFAFAEAFDVRGIPVVVCDRDLASALRNLSIIGRSIVLMSYFLGMSDKEIGRRIGMKRSTVQYQRSKALSQLRRIMESEDD